MEDESEQVVKTKDLNKKGLVQDGYFYTTPGGKVRHFDPELHGSGSAASAASEAAAATEEEEAIDLAVEEEPKVSASAAAATEKEPKTVEKVSKETMLKYQQMKKMGMHVDADIELALESSDEDDVVAQPKQEKGKKGYQPQSRKK